MQDDLERMEAALQRWGAWLSVGGRGAGYPMMSVLHPSWLPPAPGQAPTMRAAKGPSMEEERRLHEVIGRLSVRTQNTLVVVYVYRLVPGEQALRLDCAQTTVRARVVAAKRVIARALSGGLESYRKPVEFRHAG